MFMHRLSSSVAFAACLLGGCERRAGPGSLTDADRSAIRESVANFDKAMVAGDWPSVLSHYSEDGILMPPNGPEVKGRAAMQKFFQGFPKITEFKENVLEIEGHGDLAYPRGTYEMTMVPPGAGPLKDKGKVLAVWRKQPDGSWLVTRVIWSSDLPAR
jgi:uncharacterized protein (TIGR02246 family)